MEVIAENYAADTTWALALRKTHISKAHGTLPPSFVLRRAASFLLEHIGDGAAQVAGLPAIQAMWNVLAFQAEEERDSPKPPPPGEPAEPLAESIEASVLLQAAVCAIFVWGSSHAQAAYSGAHLVASVANPTNPAGFAILAPPSAATAADDVGLPPAVTLDPVEAARVVGAAMLSYPAVPEVAGASCLALDCLMSADWCGKSLQKLVSPCFSSEPSCRLHHLASLITTSSPCDACVVCDKDALHLFNSLCTHTYPPRPFPIARRPALYPGLYPAGTPERYGSSGGRALLSQVLAAAPAACGAVGRHAHEARVPWCRRLLRDMLGEDLGDARRVVVARPARSTLSSHPHPPTLPRFSSLPFHTRSLLPPLPRIFLSAACL